MLVGVGVTAHGSPAGAEKGNPCALEFIVDSFVMWASKTPPGWMVEAGPDTRPRNRRGKKGGEPGRQDGVTGHPTSLI